MGELLGKLKELEISAKWREEREAKLQSSLELTQRTLEQEKRAKEEACRKHSLQGARIKDLEDKLAKADKDLAKSAAEIKKLQTQFAQNKHKTEVDLRRAGQGGGGGGKKVSTVFAESGFVSAVVGDLQTLLTKVEEENAGLRARLAGMAKEKEKAARFNLPLASLDVHVLPALLPSRNVSPAPANPRSAPPAQKRKNSPGGGGNARQIDALQTRVRELEAALAGAEIKLKMRADMIDYSLATKTTTQTTTTTTTTLIPEASPQQENDDPLDAFFSTLSPVKMANKKEIF